ncbi:hypothetical protein V8C42DRAFT_318511 [Trichoderma barbatum]
MVFRGCCSLLLCSALLSSTLWGQQEYFAPKGCSHFIRCNAEKGGTALLLATLRHGDGATRSLTPLVVLHPFILLTFSYFFSRRLQDTALTRPRYCQLLAPAPTSRLCRY